MNHHASAIRRIASRRIVNLGLTCVLLWSAGTAVANAQTAAPPETPATLNCDADIPSA